MDKDLKRLTDFLVDLGLEKIGHSHKTYLGHLISLHRLMQTQGCDEGLCRAGMFHSIYGTELFQGFKLGVELRPDVRALIGERPEQLAYLNCAMDRATFDRAAQEDGETYRIRDRITGEEVTLTRTDFDDLCRIHLFDWLEQAPRSRFGWDYRRAGYRRLAERCGGTALATYDRVFAAELASEKV